MLPLVMFVIGVGAVFGAYALISHYLPGAMARRELDQRLRDVSMPFDAAADGDSSVVKKIESGPLPMIGQIVSKTNYGSYLSRLIEQSGSKTNVSAVVVMMIMFGAVGALLGLIFVHFPLVALLLALLGGALPIVMLVAKRNKRMKRFEEQFPEALDLLSRAIRAGHAFQTAMGMVADELADPVGPEFKKTFDQQNFGLPLRDALNQLAERVNILDVRFFVTAVLIQRDTGGNLAEILDNLAHVVRERFKIRRQVRVHTAHGRFTGYVLLGLPAALGIALSVINPAHMELLFREHMGQVMLMIAVVMQIIGFLWIRNIIRIEV